MLYTSHVKTDAPSFVDITSEIKKAIADSGVVAGMCIVTVSDARAALALMETENKKACADVLRELDRAVPPRLDYGEDPYGCAAATKAALLSASKDLPVEGGTLSIGEGRGVYLVDFLGGKYLEFNVKCM
ncbi:MAG TPA: YjbQ family protein [Clostridia bacterium]|nr:YjbQ family protein [Clostridia bacterium]